jgi:hypothetical protein
MRLVVPRAVCESFMLNGWKTTSLTAKIEKPCKDNSRDSIIQTNIASMSATSSTSLALQTYEPPVRDRRVHLDDLSGVLELIVLACLVYALRSLRKRELSLAQFTHVICMLSVLFIGGHFVEEHVLGVRKLEGLLKFGFQALCKFYLLLFIYFSKV